MDMLVFVWFLTKKNERKKNKFIYLEVHSFWRFCSTFFICFFFSFTLLALLTACSSRQINEMNSEKRLRFLLCSKLLKFLSRSLKWTPTKSLSVKCQTLKILDWSSSLYLFRSFSSSSSFCCTFRLIRSDGYR